MSFLRNEEGGSNKGIPMVRRPVSVRAPVGLVNLTEPKLKDDTWRNIKLELVHRTEDGN